MGDKCESRQVGDKCEIMRSKNPECLWQENKPGDKRKIMRPEHAPFQMSKNPSQVDLFGEQINFIQNQKHIQVGSCPKQNMEKG